MKVGKISTAWYSVKDDRKALEDGGGRGGGRKDGKEKQRLLFQINQKFF